MRFGREWFARFLALQGFDRAVAIAGQAFTALIPLLIVYSAIASRATGRDFADRLIQLFDLTGSAAATVQQAFAPSSTQTEIGVLGAVLLIASALSFTRALQRLYQLALDQPPLGIAAAKWGLLWLVMIIVIGTARPWVLEGVHGATDVAFTIAMAAAVWLGTPYILLARRVPWRRLAPTAVLTTTGMTALSVGSAVWMPHYVADSAEQFGTIGVAFALLSWLVGAGLVLVISAAGGALIDARVRKRAASRM